MGSPWSQSLMLENIWTSSVPTKIYRSPLPERLREKGKSRIGRAVCLVGAGARFERGEYIRYLWFRNSYGRHFGMDGDGMICFADIILDPYVISLWGTVVVLNSLGLALSLWRHSIQKQRFEAYRWTMGLSGLWFWVLFLAMWDSCRVNQACIDLPWNAKKLCLCVSCYFFYLS
jgi:hypothetical protein